MTIAVVEASLRHSCAWRFLTHNMALLNCVIRVVEPVGGRLVGIVGWAVYADSVSGRDAERTLDSPVRGTSVEGCT